MKQKNNIHPAERTYLAPQVEAFSMGIERGFSQSVDTDTLPTLYDDWTNEDFA